MMGIGSMSMGLRSGPLARKGSPKNKTKTKKNSLNSWKVIRSTSVYAEIGNHLQLVTRPQEHGGLLVAKNCRECNHKKKFIHKKKTSFTSLHFILHCMKINFLDILHFRKVLLLIPQNGLGICMIVVVPKS